MAQYVRDEDRLAYRDAVFEILMPLAQRPVERLYHYTTGDALIAIINSGVLRTTQVANLNDEREIVYAMDLLKEAIDRRRASPMSKDVQYLFNTIVHNLPDARTEILPVFVACFSANHDDLSQWRAYAGPECGYAIEFDCTKMRQSSLDRGGVLLPVEYDPASQSRMLDKIVTYTEIFFREGLAQKRAPSMEAWYNDFMAVWEQRAALVAAFIKAPAFRGENEWRLVYYLTEDDRQRMQFVQRRSMITRHVPLPFVTTPDGKYTPLPINSVVIGPTSNKRAARLGVGDLLRSKQYIDLPIAHTDIPYRIT